MDDRTKTMPDFVQAAAREALRIEVKLAATAELRSKLDGIHAMLRAYGWPIGCGDDGALKTSIPYSQCRVVERFDPIETAIASMAEVEDEDAQDHIDEAGADVAQDDADAAPAQQAEAPAPRWPSDSDERPSGMPSNKELCFDIVAENPGLTPVEWVIKVRALWWKRAPTAIKSVLYEYIGKGIQKVEGKFYLDADAPRTARSKPPAPLELAKPSRPSESPSNVAVGARIFQHEGKAIELSRRHWNVACRLRDLMATPGAFIDHRTLVTKTFQGEQRPVVDPRIWCEDAANEMNVKLEQLGLRVECYQHMGWFMKAIER